MKHILILITAALGMVVIGLLTLPWISADPIADEARSLSAEIVTSEEPAPADDEAYFADFGDSEEAATEETGEAETGSDEATLDEPAEADEELTAETDEELTVTAEAEVEVDATETETALAETEADFQESAENTEATLSSEQEGVQEDSAAEEPMQEETTLEEGEDASLPETASQMPLIGLLGLLCLGGVLALRVARR